MPPVQQDELLAINTTLTFENLNNTVARKFMHNGTDILKLNSGDTITYFQTDGEEKLTYAFDQPDVVDLTYDPVNAKYYAARVVNPSGTPYLRVERVNALGILQQTSVEFLDVLPPTGTYANLKNWKVGIAVDPSQVMYVSYSGHVSRFSVASPTTGVAVPGVTAGFTIGSGVMSQVPYSFSYNDTNGGFLSYINYNTLTDVVSLKSVSASTVPSGLARTLFIEIPDWQEQELASRPYQPFYHEPDNDTLLYFRRHGTSLLNTIKVSGTLGNVATSGTVFTDAGSNYITAGIKEGDLLIINETSYASNGTYRIVGVQSANQLTTISGLVAGANLGYRIVSNAALLQFNASTNISAFTSVNVDDFNLRAGTSDTANITVLVINAWGDALSGKTCNFQLLAGDGVINPASDITDGSGEANSQYTAGATAGTVQIQVTVSD